MRKTGKIRNLIIFIGVAILAYFTAKIIIQGINGDGDFSLSVMAMLIGFYGIGTVIGEVFHQE